MFQAVKATQVKSRARIALQGPAGSGKTYSALILAQGFGGKVYVIDTERGTAAKYAREWKGFEYYVVPFEPPYTPKRFVDAIQYCVDQGADVIIIDSLSHEWSGEGGALEMVDTSKSKYGSNTYYAWRDVTPAHNQMIDAMLQCDAHLISTMRTKVAYAEVMENGRTHYQKKGLDPIQRAGVDYEFDIVMELDLGHRAIVTKSRYSNVADAVFSPISKTDGEKIIKWIETGEDPPPPVKTKQDLVAWGETIGLSPQKIKEGLDKAGLEFDPENWDEMIASLTKFSQTLENQGGHEESDNVEP